MVKKKLFPLTSGIYDQNFMFKSEIHPMYCIVSIQLLTSMQEIIAHIKMFPILNEIIRKVAEY